MIENMVICIVVRWKLKLDIEDVIKYKMNNVVYKVLNLINCNIFLDMFVYFVILFEIMEVVGFIKIFVVLELVFKVKVVFVDKFGCEF